MGRHVDALLGDLNEPRGADVFPERAKSLDIHRRGRLDQDSRTGSCEPLVVPAERITRCGVAQPVAAPGFELAALEPDPKPRTRVVRGSLSRHFARP